MFSLEQLPIDIISVSLLEKEDSRTVDSAKDGKMNVSRKTISVLLRRKPCFIISKLCDLSHIVLCTQNIIIHVNIFSHFFLFHSYYFNDVIVKINL